MIQTGKHWAQETVDAMQRLQAEGVNLFDHNYRCTNKGQKPEKFDCSYTNRFEQGAAAFCLDRFITERPEFIYAITVDKNGYAPAHHSKVSKPLTGNFEVDNLQKPQSAHFQWQSCREAPGFSHFTVPAADLCT